MRAITTIILILISLTVSAGGYYNPSIDTYDSVTGLYYKSVESKKKSGFLGSGGKAITNLYVYNPTTNEGKLIFPESESFQIIALAFEEAVEDGVVRFHSSYAAPVKNNNGIENRSPKPTMLILARNTETGLETFYLSDKNGSGLTKVRSISPTISWHIDVKNSMIRLVSQVGNDIKVESFAW